MRTMRPVLGSSSSSSSLRRSLIPDQRRIAAKRSMTISKRLTIATPATIMMALRTMAPMIPHTSTRCCSARGVLKWEKTSTKTKRLSTERAYSIR